MKVLQRIVLAACLGLSLVSVPALAHGHGRWGVVIDVPLWPVYYPGPWYGPAYPPAVVTVPAPAPTVYIEQPQASAPVVAAQAPQTSYWYHCAKPEGYYPYVKECSLPWEKVLPQPPGQ